MTVTDQTPGAELSFGDDVKAQLKEWGERLKTELADRIDQALDELGARIGG